MDEFKKMQNDMEVLIGKLSQVSDMKILGENMIPKESGTCIIDGKKATVSFGMTGKMICLTFENPNDFKEIEEKIKKEKQWQL